MLPLGRQNRRRGGNSFALTNSHLNRRSKIQIKVDPTQLIFPECGITLQDCLDVAGFSHRAAAKKLGIARSHFTNVAKKIGISPLFFGSTPKTRCVSKEDIIRIAESKVTQRDAAFLLGIDYTYLKVLIKEYGIRDKFISKSEACSVARKGYCSHNLVQSMR